MNTNGHSLIAFLLCFLLLNCSNTKTNNVTDGNTELTYPLETNIPNTIKQNILVKINDSIIHLSEYPINESDSSVLKSLKAYYCDIDKDGINELWASFNHGGNAVINQTVIFKKNDNIYEQVYLLEGETSLQSDTVSFYFNSITKYFHTCGTCAIQLNYPIFPEIKLKYNKGLNYLETDNDLNHKIENNLSKLRAKGLPSIDEMGSDDGTHKAYLENLVVYYFNNYGNIDLTKQLYDNTFSGNAKLLIWGEINDIINNISKGLKINKSPEPNNNIGHDLGACKWCKKAIKEQDERYDIWENKPLLYKSSEDEDTETFLFWFFCSKSCAEKYINSPSSIKKLKDSEASQLQDKWTSKNNSE